MESKPAPRSATKGFTAISTAISCAAARSSWPSSRTTAGGATLRAIEHRRAIARSANTGRSGFISARGDVGETLGWEERGVISARVPLNSELTFYTRYGDYPARISEYVLLLCLLYYVAYRVKRKNHLVQ